MRKPEDRINERGQAFVELTAGLIGIMIILVFIISTSTMGVEGVRALISARENADTGAGGLVPSYIQDWDIGEDNITFSKDDSNTLGPMPDNSLFSGQLGNNGTIGLVGHADFGSDPLVTGAQQSDIFLDASFLEGSQGDNENITEDLLTDIGLMESFRRFFGFHSIDMAGHESNQVFMPELNE